MLPSILKNHVIFKIQATKLIVEAAQRDDKAGAFPHLRPQVIRQRNFPARDVNALVFFLFRKKKRQGSPDSTLMEPWCIWTISKTTARPSPIPSAGKRQELARNMF